MPRSPNRDLPREIGGTRTLGGLVGFAFFIVAMLIRHYLNAPDWTLWAIIVTTPFVVYWVNRAGAVDRMLHSIDQAEQHARIDDLQREARIQARLADAFSRSADPQQVGRAPAISA